MLPTSNKYLYRCHAHTERPLSGVPDAAGASCRQGHQRIFWFPQFTHSPSFDRHNNQQLSIPHDRLTAMPPSGATDQDHDETAYCLKSQCTYPETSEVVILNFVEAEQYADRVLVNRIHIACPCVSYYLARLELQERQIKASREQSKSSMTVWRVWRLLHMGTRAVVKCAVIIPSGWQGRCLNLIRIEGSKKKGGINFQGIEHSQVAI